MIYLLEASGHVRGHYARSLPGLWQNRTATFFLFFFLEALFFWSFSPLPSRASRYLCLTIIHTDPIFLFHHLLIDTAIG
jgi:hypothetical protein